MRSLNTLANTEKLYSQCNTEKEERGKGVSKRRQERETETRKETVEQK